MLQRECHSDSQLKPWWVDRSVVACVARTLMPSLDDCVSGGNTFLTMEKIEIRHNQVYRLARRQTRALKLKTLLRRLLQRRH